MLNSCSEEQVCLKVLEGILDEESTPEEEERYFEHIQKCWSCFQNYNLEKAIRELIKTKIEKRKVPEGLVEKIKSEIEKSSID
jgi:anti-sigma factor (TIGR02949 family)